MKYKSVAVNLYNIKICFKEVIGFLKMQTSWRTGRRNKTCLAKGQFLKETEKWGGSHYCVSELGHTRYPKRRTTF